MREHRAKILQFLDVLWIDTFCETFHFYRVLGAGPVTFFIFKVDCSLVINCFFFALIAFETYAWWNIQSLDTIRRNGAIGSILFYIVECPARVWPHFRIEPFERARTRKRVSSFAFDNHLPSEKHVHAIAYQLTVYFISIFSKKR